MPSHNVIAPRMFLALGIAALAMMLTGCVATIRARSAEPSGFLKNTSQLREGTGDEPNLIYINQQADFRKYYKIILDPIRIYAGGEKSDLKKVDPEDLKNLVDYFDATLREQLGSYYTFVTTPGPDTMRVRIALTELDNSNVPMDVISSVMPIGMATNALRRIVTGRAGWVGSANAEFELLDSATNQRLAAAIDRQIGRKYTGRVDKFDSWHTVKSAFDSWAERLSTRLEKLRGAPPAGAAVKR